MFSNLYQGKRIWLSGHTGFKGAWLSEWLLGLGAEVHGYSLAPTSTPALFDQLELEPRIHSHQIADIRQMDAVRESLLRARPDFVFHLAAQPIVRRSFVHPLETYETNVNGTLHVLEALRSIDHPCTAVFITTDKCYENREHGLPYTEDNHLGGRDPYSSSKAMAEICISAYRRSYFESADSIVRIASARAGNVIGGGDWAEDRIVPDCMRALQKDSPIFVRNPSATRPWQHVLEPLSGYLWYGALLSLDSAIPRSLNFGPDPECNRSVADLVSETLKCWPGTWMDGSGAAAVHEAKLLNLSIDKAASLGWRPVWNFERTVKETVEWYRAIATAPERAHEVTTAQVFAYAAEAKAAGAVWTAP
jgi:CDP-glucose 4,6-dehydratase